MTETLMTYMTHSMDRLTHPGLVFGLAVRFFGVFLVLIIVMIGIWLSGKVIQALEARAKGSDKGGKGPRAVPAPAGAGPVPAPGADTSAMPDEVAAAIGLALSEYQQARSPQINLPATAGGCPLAQGGSSWRAAGRQEAFSRQLPGPGFGKTK